MECDDISLMFDGRGCFGLLHCLMRIWKINAREAYFDVIVSYEAIIVIFLCYKYIFIQYYFHIKILLINLTSVFVEIDIVGE